MKSKLLKATTIIVLALLLIPTSGWAKADGYCYAVGYSYKLKKLFCTPIFKVKVRDVSYSATEYVAEMDLINKIEVQIQNHLASNKRETASDVTFAARGAFKSQAFAMQDLTEEKKEFAKKGFEVIDLTNFLFIK